MSNSLAKGTKTVKVDGKNPAAIKGSEYSRCNGDEPGTAGGVKSSTNMKEATWLLYSFDVKLEGKNACRLSDKMMMNHGNTACLGGTIHAPVIDPNVAEELKEIVCKCDREKKQAPAKKKQKTCRQLGTEKHKCCEKEIKKRKNPQIQGETGFGKPPNYKRLSAKSKGALRAKGVLGGTSWPDCTITDTNGNKQFVDFKFKCPPNTPTRKKKKGGHSWIKTSSSGAGPYPTWTSYKDGTTQEDKYRDAGKANGINSDPTIVDNKGC